MTPLYAALLSALFVSAAGLIGVLVLNVQGRRANLLLALAAGAMIGNALLHLLPHALTLEQKAIESHNPPAIMEIFHHDEHEEPAKAAPKNFAPHLDEYIKKHQHDHGAHKGHDHAAHEEHKGHDHAAHEEHKGHDHAAHEDHKGHDHAAHEDHRGHDHAAHQGHDDHAGHGHTGLFTCLMLLAGLLIFYAFDLFMQRTRTSDKSGSVQSEGWMVLIADMAENLLDGIVIGTAYALSFPAGIAATLTIFLHEIPLEMGDYAVLRKAGFSRKNALFANFTSGLVSVVGALIAVGLGYTLEGFALYITPIAAGGFLYIAGSILIPKLRSECCNNHHWQYLLVSLVGVAIMVAVLFFE